MCRVLTILAAVAALAVTAAPIASAGNSKKPQPPGTAGSTLIGEVTFPKARGARVINSLAQKYTVSAPKPPPAMVTPSGGETLASDWVKAPPKPRRQDGGSGSVAPFGDTPGLGGGDMAVRRPATPKAKASGLKAGFPDGTSNTMMRSGSLKPLYGIIAILIG